MYKIAFVCFFFFQAVLSAQVGLRPTISSGKLPADTSAIAAFKSYRDESNKFIKSGFHILDTVPDFTLFDTAGKPVTLSQVCAEGKPVLLISGSYSCPLARDGLDDVLPFIINNFGNQLNILFIYTLEAHPNAPDVCPYSDSVVIPKENIKDKIACKQHTTYGSRKALAKMFISNESISVPVLLDDVSNGYLTHFGPAPNNAYLIRPDGVVFNHYGWFGKSKKQVSYDIYVLLNMLKKQPEVIQLKVERDSANLLHLSGGKTYTVEIYNTDGEMVAQKSESGNEVFFPLDQYVLTRGNYTIRVFSSAYEYRMLRFVKN
ncbi:MAG: hypothetical protein ACRCYO_01700 [Bacteroidia bacterium]